MTILSNSVHVYKDILHSLVGVAYMSVQGEHFLVGLLFNCSTKSRSLLTLYHEAGKDADILLALRIIVVVVLVTECCLKNMSFTN